MIQVPYSERFGGGAEGEVATSIKAGSINYLLRRTGWGWVFGVLKWEEEGGGVLRVGLGKVGTIFPEVVEEGVNDNHTGGR